MNKLLLGDCRDELRGLPDCSVDSIVTDPPYELGFMGKKWDASGIAYSVELWRECLRVLKPGGHLLAFGGTRTYHRMVVAIEDAGFEVRDMIEWVYGSGFPKSLSVGKSVDKLQGNEREVVGEKPTLHHGTKDNVQKYGFATEGNIDITKGNSEYEGWGTALKPAHEPICMARKPLAEKTVAENCLKWGTGGINVDGSRVGTEQIENGREGRQVADSTSYHDGLKPTERNMVTGRFPANLILGADENGVHDEVRGCFPETGKSTGGRIGCKDTGVTSVFTSKNSGLVGKYEAGDPGFGDSGSASRFFKSIIYEAKASKKERNRGCEGLENRKGGSMEANISDTMQLGGASLKGEPKEIQPTKNFHPTIKPIALMSYLIKMVTPLNGTVLDPFMGSGSTGVAAKETGFNFIGIEREAEYIEIAKARIGAVKKELTLF